jgi:hypothetical protein
MVSYWEMEVPPIDLNATVRGELLARAREPTSEGIVDAFMVSHLIVPWAVRTNGQISLAFAGHHLEAYGRTYHHSNDLRSDVTSPVSLCAGLARVGPLNLKSNNSAKVIQGA